MSFVPCTMFVLHSRDRFETKMAYMLYTKCCCTLQSHIIKINIFAERDAFLAPYYAVRGKENFKSPTENRKELNLEQNHRHLRMGS